MTSRLQQLNFKELSDRQYLEFVIKDISSSILEARELRDKVPGAAFDSSSPLYEVRTFVPASKVGIGYQVRPRLSRGLCDLCPVSWPSADDPVTGIHSRNIQEGTLEPAAIQIVERTLCCLLPTVHMLFEQFILHT